MVQNIATRQKHPVWKNNDYIEELRFSIIALVAIHTQQGSGALKALYNKIEKRLLEITPDGDFPRGVSYEAFRRFACFESVPGHPVLLDAAADVVIKQMPIEEEAGRKHLYHAFLSEALIEERQAFAEDGSDVRSIGKEDMVAARHHKGIGENVLNMEEGGFQRASALLTGETEPVSSRQRSSKVAHYFGYRYSSYVGQIVRSGFTFYPSTSKDRVCRFDHQMRQHDGTLRLVRGVAFTQGDYLYMAGRVRDAGGIKVMAFPVIGGRKPELLSGVMLSKVRTPLVGRLMLHRSQQKITDPEVFSAAADDPRRAEFQDPFFLEHIKPKLRNECEFLLQETILKRIGADGDEKYETLTQDEMVAEVGDLLKKKYFLSHDGDPANKRDFNPAKHSHYPFNQAITDASGA